MSDNSFVSTIISSGPDENKWQTLIALLASSVGFVVAVVNSIAAYFRDRKQMEELAAQERRFEAFKKELDDKQRRLVRFENVQDLMQTYKKPLLQSAFDLQSRLANQVKSNFLYQFANRGNARDRDYARLNMAYVIAEFLGWLEVIRQEIVFITGVKANDLSLIIDALKFQFTGESEVQGAYPRDRPPPGLPHVDEHGGVLQLYAGELRAIGEVMIQERTYDDDTHVGPNLTVLGFAEFVRRQSAKPPGGGREGCVEAEEWGRSKEKMQQDTLSSLMGDIDTLMTLDDKEAPKRRMTILQVLLCKLIEVLDDAVPWEAGPEYDMEAGEEPRYIPRDFRLSPLVGHLTSPQRKWLTSQRFMEKVHPVETSVYNEWDSRIRELPEDEQLAVFRLAFVGFREDLHLATKGGWLSQSDREKKLDRDAFPGAFPPRMPRLRPHWWWASLSAEDFAHYSEEARARQRTPPLTHHALFHKTGSLALRNAAPGGCPQLVARTDSSRTWFTWARQRKVSPTGIKPEPSYTHYTRPAVLTQPSTHGLGAPSRAESMVTPLHANPRQTAGL